MSQTQVFRLSLERIKLQTPLRMTAYWDVLLLNGANDRYEQIAMMGHPVIRTRQAGSDSGLRCLNRGDLRGRVAGAIEAGNHSHLIADVKVLTGGKTTRIKRDLITLLIPRVDKH